MGLCQAFSILLFFLEKFFLRNRAWGTWCSVVSDCEFEKGVGRLYATPTPINRLKSTGYLQSLTFVRVWHCAQKDRQNCRSIPIGAGRAVYVMPSNRVARLGAAICGAGCETVLMCLVFFLTSLLPR